MGQSIHCPARSSAQNVYVIDDDRDVRMSMGMLLRSCGKRVRPFGTGKDFLEELQHLPPGCLLIDIRMPDLDGLSLLDRMRKTGCKWPAFIMTGHGDVRNTVRAMKLGALDFLEKPILPDELIRTVDEGFRVLDEYLSAQSGKAAALLKLEKLTRRERDMLEGVLAGRSNKEQARHLGLSPRTVEMHRAAMMQRLEVATLQEVFAVALDAGLHPARD